MMNNAELFRHSHFIDMLLKTHGNSVSQNNKILI